MECDLLALFLLVVLHPASASGSCRKAKLCCPGRDSSCAVQTASLNTVIEDLNDKPCYCDHACLKVGDCCDDFQDACGATNCEVSEWGPWSQCSTDCGTGDMTRERQILRAPSNGGFNCPEMVQKRSCYGTRCEGKSVAKAHRETAMILPARYSDIRSMNATHDIRKNLRLRYRKDPAEENVKKYCIVFEITKVRKTCENLGEEISSMLSKGSQACVICETAAMRKHLGYRCNGHGVDHKQTRWAFLADPQCHGRWQRKEKTEQCPCHPDGKPDFIFV